MLGAELLDELQRCDRLRAITRTRKRGEMGVFGDEIVCIRSDGAVGEFVIIRITCFLRVQEAATLLCEIQYAGELLPAVRSTMAHNHLAVFQEDFGADSPNEASA